MAHLGQKLNNLATARRQLAGNGTQAAGLAYGGTTGSQTNATEEFTYADGVVLTFDVS